MSTNYVWKECSICHQEYCVSPDLFEDLNEFKIEEDSKELVCKECFEELEGSDE
jgi:hypothetical protein